MTTKAPIKLLYILGSGHSGSTLSDLILGSHSQIESGGEINAFQSYFGQNSDRPKEKRICTCEVHVEDCEYWGRVRQELNLLGGNVDLDIQAENQKEFEENNYRLMKAMLTVSAKEIFCDSSKQYSRLKKFLKSNLFEVTILHLVRDGRAVAYSRQKKAARKADKLDRVGDYKDLYYEGLNSWKRTNAKIHAKFGHRDRYHRLRYEDLVDNPEKVFIDLLGKLNLEFESDQLQFWSQTHHNLSGNRMRRNLFSNGQPEIRMDMSYLENLSFNQWWLGNLYTLSALRRFGYPLRKEALLHRRIASNIV